MAWTSADLTTIRAARLRGVRTVQFGDRQVTYASDAEMRQVEQDIARELTAIAQRPKHTRLVGSKGFD